MSYEEKQYGKIAMLGRSRGRSSTPAKRKGPNLGSILATALKTSKGGSKTHTKTQTKTKDKTRDLTGPHSMQILKLGGRPPKTNVRFMQKVIRALVPSLKSNNQANTQLACTSGTSAFQQTSPFPSEADLANMKSCIGGAGNVTKFLLETARVQISVVSAETANIFVKAYLVQARFDLPSSIVLTALNLLRQGFIDMGTTFTLNVLGTAPVGLQCNLSTRIWDSKKFLSYFKIKKQEQYQLQPGESKQYSITDNRPKVINCEVLDNTNNYMSKGGLLWIFQVQGTAADDGATHLVVGTTGAKVNIVQQENYTFRAVPANNAGATYFNSNPVITAPSVISSLIGSVVADASD